VALRLPIPPPWLFLIGASSGGKSMLLNSLAHVKGYIALDDLTTNTLMSGKQSGGREYSLLQRLSNNSFLTFKDFTTILSKQKETRGAIIGLLRKVYDGEITKATGNDDKLNDWERKIGVLGGSTSTFHSKMGEFSDMGERIILYTFDQPDKRELGRWIMKHGINDDAAKKDMREAFKAYLDSPGLVFNQQLPELSLEIQDDLLDLAELTTKARSSVERDLYDRNKPITMIHLEEQIARFLKQLMAMAYGLLILNKHDEIGEGKFLSIDKKLLYKIALDSIPMIRRLVLVELTRYTAPTTAQAIGTFMGLTTSTITYALQDLNAYKMVDKQVGHGEHLWELKPYWKEIIKKFEYLDTSIKFAPEEEPDEPPLMEWG